MLIEILKSIVFGIVQGITEWLPISSTGHLILLETFLPLQVYDTAAANTEFWDMYKVVIQFGSILAVLVLYWQKLNPFSSRKDEVQKKRTWRLWVLIIIACIPAGIAGVLLNDLIDAKLSTPVVIAIALIVYGVLFLKIRQDDSTARIRSIRGMDVGTALKIGCYQALALIPGTSRSGSTILGATLCGCSRTCATEFSFFMAIPVMLGASVLKLVKMQVSLTAGALAVLLVGMVVAFLVSVAVIRYLLAYIRQHDFRVFGIYRIILGVLILILAAAGILPAAVSA